jgi:hypothetical protein
MSDITLNKGDRFTATFTSPYRLVDGGELINEVRHCLCEVTEAGDFGISYKVVELTKVDNASPWCSMNPADHGGGITLKYAHRYNVKRV